jgi:hypothetical protein
MSRIPNTGLDNLANMFDTSDVSGEPRRLPAQRDDLRQLSQATGLFIQVTVLLLAFFLWLQYVGVRGKYR